MHLPHPLSILATTRPTLRLLEVDGTSVSAGEMREHVARLAGGLRSQGIEAGTTVALWGTPSLAWVQAFHAVGWLGAVALPLPANGPESLIAEALRSNEVGFLLTDRPGLEGPWRTLSLAALPTAEPATERAWPLEEVRLRMLTSGTTGTPRTCALTTRQLFFSAMGSALRLGHRPDDRWLDCLPLHHIGGLSILLRSLWLGISVSLHPRFDPAAVNAEVDAGRVTMISLVPAMLERLLDDRREKPFPASLRVVLLGGQACTEDLLTRCRPLRVPLALTWGMTETASQIATRVPGDLRPLAEAGAGPPLPFARVTVGEDSRLRVGGPLAPKEGFATADLGHLDAEGNVHITGRADDVIVSGGENVHLPTVAATLRAHPLIKDVCVVAVPDATWGMRPVAAVELNDPAQTIDAEALRGWVRTRRPPQDVPAVVKVVEALPRNDLGKIRSGVVRQWFVGDEADADEPLV